MIGRYPDKYGSTHRTAEECDFANLSLDMMQWFLNEIPLGIVDAEALVSKLIDKSKEGQVARDRVRAFITLIEAYHKSVAVKNKRT